MKWTGEGQEGFPSIRKTDARTLAVAIQRKTGLVLPVLSDGENGCFQCPLLTARFTKPGNPIGRDVGRKKKELGQGENSCFQFIFASKHLKLFLCNQALCNRHMNNQIK